MAKELAKLDREFHDRLLGCRCIAGQQSCAVCRGPRVDADVEIKRIMRGVQSEIDAGAKTCSYCGKENGGHTLACSALRADL